MEGIEGQTRRDSATHGPTAVSLTSAFCFVDVWAHRSGHVLRPVRIYADHDTPPHFFWTPLGRRFDEDSDERRTSSLPGRRFDEDSDERGTSSLPGRRFDEDSDEESSSLPGRRFNEDSVSSGAGAGP